MAIATKIDTQMPAFPLSIVPCSFLILIDDVGQIDKYGTQNRLGQYTNLSLSHLNILPVSLPYAICFSQSLASSIWL